MFPREHDISRMAVGYEQQYCCQNQLIWIQVHTTVDQNHIIKMCSNISVIFFSFSLFQNKLIFIILFQISLCKRSSQRCFILTAEPTVKCLWWKPSSFLVYFYLEILYSQKNNESEVALSFSSKTYKQDVLSLWWTVQCCQNLWLQTQSSISLAHVSGFVQREQNMWQSLAGNILEFI